VTARGEIFEDIQMESTYNAGNGRKRKMKMESILWMALKRLRRVSLMRDGRKDGSGGLRE
jgi:hypothetical protein